MIILPSVSILGCGWFGFPLAKQLINSGFAVKGSTTSPDKIRLLEASNIGAFLVQFPIGGTDDQLISLFNSDILVLNIPPKGRPGEFVQNIKQLIALLTTVKQVIFISSTSVYGDSNSTVDETVKPNPETESGKALAEVEEILKAQSGFVTTIIRFAGLVGPARHPGRFLAGKKNVPNGLAPVNLIHLDDCIGIVQEIILKKKFGHTFNACLPHHPTRKEFYTKAAARLGLEQPEFIEEKTNWKIVESVNVPKLLGYTFNVADWDDWLKST